MTWRSCADGTDLPRKARAVVAGFIVATIAGCSSDGTRLQPTPSPVRASATASPIPSPSRTISLASCSPPVARAALHVVHRFSVSPDDIAVDASGRLWISARTANQLFTLSPAGGTVSITKVTGGPEGIASAPSGIYVAQQNLNAIEEVAPQHRTVVAFPNHTTNAGIDGISVGPTSDMLLVPDSPAGSLIEVSLIGSSAPKVIATGLGRPVSATVSASGDIFVAGESTPGLVVIAPDGAVKRIGGFTDLDEVVSYGGLLYVTELNRHDVVAVDPASGASAVLAIDLPAPQGLAVTADGVLEVVDATTDTLYSLRTCGGG